MFRVHRTQRYIHKDTTYLPYAIHTYILLTIHILSIQIIIQITSWLLASTHLLITLKNVSTLMWLSPRSCATVWMVLSTASRHRMVLFVLMEVRWRASRCISLDVDPFFSTATGWRRVQWVTRVKNRADNHVFHPFFDYLLRKHVLRGHNIRSNKMCVWTHRV